MTRSTILTLFVVVLGPLQAQADLELELVSPGLGRFSVGPSYTEVEETEDGHRVAFHLEPGGGWPLSVKFEWSSDVWSALSIADDSMEPDEFAPFGNENGISLFAFAPLVLPPRPQRGGKWELDFSVLALCEPNCPLRDDVGEYRVVEIDEPLPGDFNIDNKVDLVDFVTLSANFGQRKFQPGQVFLSWMDGDANLDDRIDFTDFIIVSMNYGAVRETPPAAVPEPASAMLLGVAWLGLGAVQRRVNALVG